MKYLILFFISVSFLSSCTLSHSSEENPITVSSNFVRSLVTKDTILFQSTIDVDSLINYFNVSDSVSDYRSFDVRNILFFHFAPLKMSPEKLEARRMSTVPLSQFAMDEISVGEKVFKTKVKWAETEKDSLKTLILTLYEKEPKVWKIKAIDFPKPQ